MGSETLVANSCGPFALPNSFNWNSGSTDSSIRVEGMNQSTSKEENENSITRPRLRRLSQTTTTTTTREPKFVEMGAGRCSPLFSPTGGALHPLPSGLSPQPHHHPLPFIPSPHRPARASITSTRPRPRSNSSSATMGGHPYPGTFGGVPTSSISTTTTTGGSGRTGTSSVGGHDLDKIYRSDRNLEPELTPTIERPHYLGHSIPLASRVANHSDNLYSNRSTDHNHNHNPAPESSRRTDISFLLEATKLIKRRGSNTSESTSDSISSTTTSRDSSTSIKSLQQSTCGGGDEDSGVIGYDFGRLEIEPAAALKHGTSISNFGPPSLTTPLGSNVIPPPPPPHNKVTSKMTGMSFSIPRGSLPTVTFPPSSQVPMELDDFHHSTSPAMHAPPLDRWPGNNFTPASVTGGGSTSIEEQYRYACEFCGKSFF